MKTPTIPAENTDLIALVKKNDRRFLTKWLILSAVFLIPAIAFFKPAANLYGIPAAVLLLLGFVIFPFFACGGWSYLTDKGFCGTVEDMDFSVRIEMHDTMGVGTVKGTSRRGIKRHHAGQANYCKVTVNTDGGDIRSLTLRLPGDSDTFPLRIGDRIMKYHGLPYPAIVRCKTPLCSACGHIDDDGKGECRSCGCSLIVLTDA